jgi:hypothetical protein
VSCFLSTPSAFACAYLFPKHLFPSTRAKHFPHLDADGVQTSRHLRTQGGPVSVSPVVQLDRHDVGALEQLLFPSQRVPPARVIYLFMGKGLDILNVTVCSRMPRGRSSTTTVAVILYRGANYHMLFYLVKILPSLSHRCRVRCGPQWSTESILMGINNGNQ